MSKNTFQTPTSRVIDLILKEINEVETGSIELTDRVSFSQYQTASDIKTHQNGGFLTALAKGQDEDREFYDIITPMVETGVQNVDIDTKDFDLGILDGRYQAQNLLAKPILSNYFKLSNHGVKINDIVETFIDEGNVVVRKDNEGIYEKVELQNLYVIDQSAKGLEDTTVIEKQLMNQTELRRMEEWKQTDNVINSCNVSSVEEIPYYEVFTRYGELSLAELNYLKRELYSEENEDNEDDRNTYIQTQVVFARAKVKKGNPSGDFKKGFILLAEERKPEIIKITEKLKITKYKPYAEAHLGPFNGRWLRKGYRETGMPFQNRANELGNQIRQVMKLAGKILFWSSDENIAGKNIFSAVKNGQIIKAKDLQAINNTVQNLTVYGEEWNRNMELAQRALKAFEVATGEQLPSTATATAVVAQNNRVDQFYDYKREKLALFFMEVFTRWVIPALTEDMNQEHIMKIVGDPAYMEQYYEAVVNGWIAQNYIKMMDLNGGRPLDGEQIQFIKEIKIQELMKRPKQFAKIEQDFFKDIQFQIDINISGERFNKQAKITNGLSLLQYLANPVIMQNPQTKKIIIDIADSLGYRIDNQAVPVPVNPSTPQTSAAPNLPKSEISANQLLTL